MSRIDCKKILTLRLNSPDENGDVLLTDKLAKEIDVSHKVVSRMEKDITYNPGVLTILKLATFFDVTIDELVIKD